MRKARLYGYMVVWLLMVTGCIPKKSGTSEKTDWSVTLVKESKKPYGTWLASQLLPKYFPGVKFEPLSKYFRYTSIDEQMRYHPDSPALLIMSGLEDYMTDEEWGKVAQFAKAGNEVVIFAATLDHVVEEALHCHKFGYAEYQPLSFYNDGTRNERCLSLMPDTNKRYGYNGRFIGGYFDIFDSTKVVGYKDSASGDSIEKHVAPVSEPDSYEKDYSIARTPEVLGYSTYGPNFIRYRTGRGHITLHAAPLVLSNYFLLQDRNRTYFDAIWHSLPNNISVIYLNEYYKRSSTGSKLGVMMKYPPMKWGLIMSVITLLLYVLFSLKAVQRKIAIIRPPQNASVSFVETVGRLYYNKGQHDNLAEKMIQHFLEWVRTTYYLNTSQLNDAFAESLAAKSGKPIEEVNNLLTMIHDVRLGAAVDSEYLNKVYNSIQSYYKA